MSLKISSFKLFHIAVLVVLIAIGSCEADLGDATITITTDVDADAQITASASPLEFVGAYNIFGDNPTSDSVTVSCNVAGWSLKVEDTTTGSINKGHLKSSDNYLKNALKVKLSTDSTFKTMGALPLDIKTGGTASSATITVQYLQEGGSYEDSVADDYTIQIKYTVYIPAS